MTYFAIIGFGIGLSILIILAMVIYGLVVRKLRGPQPAKKPVYEEEPEDKEDEWSIYNDPEAQAEPVVQRYDRDRNRDVPRRNSYEEFLNSTKPVSPVVPSEPEEVKPEPKDDNEHYQGFSWDD